MRSGVEKCSKRILNRVGIVEVKIREFRREPFLIHFMLSRLIASVCFFHSTSYI